MIIYAGDIHAKVDSIKWIDKVAMKSGIKTVVQVGDFGALWGGIMAPCPVQDYFINRKEGPTWITCGGNHENWDAFIQLGDEQVGKDLISLAPNLFLARRGATVEIEGILHSFLGGAESTDVAWRTEGSTWWRAETPNKEEFQSFMDTIEQKKPEVLVTHDAPTSVNIWRIDRDRATTPATLEKIFRLADWKPKRHVFGHHHLLDNWKIDGVDFFCCGLHGDHWIWNGTEMESYEYKEEK